MFADKRILVTGGAGFIGSHLVDALLAAGAKVTVYDDLSTGAMDYLADARGKPGFEFVKGDVLDWPRLMRAVRGQDIVFHLAADPDVRASGERAETHLEANVTATARVLEAMLSEGVKTIAFTSTSTVYGEAPTPTPESYAPLMPISVYGATKLAGEALVSAYCGTHGFRGVSFRFANVVGPRSNHGVTFDFVRKLRKDPTRLEILGDGRQSKSYFHVADCVSGMLAAVERLGAAPGTSEVFNIGSEDAIDVRALADVVVSEMGLKDVRYELTGGVDGGRGWKGDVKTMRLAIDKLKAANWRPRYSSADAIRETARWLVRHG